MLQPPDIGPDMHPFQQQVGKYVWPSLRGTPTEKMSATPRKPAQYSVEYNVLQTGSIDGTDTEPHDRAIKRAMKALNAEGAGRQPGSL